MRGPVNVFIFLLLSICLLLSACSEPPKEPLRISSSPWPGYEPLYLARDLGYLNPNTANLFELPSSDITMESYRNRSTDLATLTLDEVITLQSEGVNSRILLTMDVSNGGDAVLARPEIKSLSDLKGKRISIVNISLGLYMLNRLLDKAGLKRSDVSVFPMAESKQLQFYKDGNADVVITFEPVKSLLIAEDAHVLFDSSMIPNEIFDILVAHEDVFIKNKEAMCEISKAWFKAINYMSTNKKDASEKITKRLGVGVENYDEMMAGIVLPNKNQNTKLLGGINPLILEPAGRLIKIMTEEKLLTQNVNPNKLIDAGFADCYQE